MPTLTSKLSPRQKEILVLLCGGNSRKQICRAVGIGSGTCDIHLRVIYLKLDVHRREQAVVIAAKEGLV